MLFVANKENLEEVPVWVRLPTLPPLLWTEDVFKVIRGGIRGILRGGHVLLGHQNQKGSQNIGETRPTGWTL